MLVKLISMASGDQTRAPLAPMSFAAQARLVVGRPILAT